MYSLRRGDYPWKDEVHTLVDRGNEVKPTRHNVSFQQNDQTTESGQERKGSEISKLWNQLFRMKEADFEWYFKNSIKNG